MAYLAQLRPLAKYDDRVVIARNVIASEHPDNDRFAKDCEVWFGQPIVEIRSDKFADHWMDIEGYARLVREDLERPT